MKHNPILGHFMGYLKVFGIFLIFLQFSLANELKKDTCQQISSEISAEIIKETYSAKITEPFKNSFLSCLTYGKNKTRQVTARMQNIYHEMAIIYGNKNNQKFLWKNLAFGLGFQVLGQAITSFGVLPWSTLSLDYIHNIVLTSLSTSLFLKSQFKPIIHDLKKAAKAKINRSALEEEFENLSHLDLIEDDYQTLYSKIKNVEDKIGSKQPLTFMEKFHSLKSKYQKDFFYSLLVLSLVNVSLDTLLSWRQIQLNPELQKDPDYLKDKAKFQISFVAVNTLKSFLITTPLYLLVNQALLDSLLRTINHVGTAIFYQCARLRYVWMPLKDQGMLKHEDEEANIFLTKLKNTRDRVIKYCTNDYSEYIADEKVDKKTIDFQSNGAIFEMEKIENIEQKIMDLNALKTGILADLFHDLTESKSK